MFETVGKLGVVVKHQEFRKSLALFNFCIIVFKFTPKLCTVKLYFLTKNF